MIREKRVIEKSNGNTYMRAINSASGTTSEFVIERGITVTVWFKKKKQLKENP